MKTKHETDVAQARRHAAGLARDKSDLQQTIDTMKKDTQRQIDTLQETLQLKIEEAKKKEEEVRRKEGEAGKREEGVRKCAQEAQERELEARQEKAALEVDMICARLFILLQAPESFKKLVSLQESQAQEMMDLLQKVRLASMVPHPFI